MEFGPDSYRGGISHRHCEAVREIPQVGLDFDRMKQSINGLEGGEMNVFDCPPARLGRAPLIATYGDPLAGLLQLDGGRRVEGKYETV